MNEKLIKELREGKVAVRNDNCLDKLRKILKTAFPHDKTLITGVADYYYGGSNKTWNTISTESIGSALARTSIERIYSVRDFFTEGNAFPRKMLVWDHDGEKKLERIVLTELPGDPAYRYVAVGVRYEGMFNSGKKYDICLYKHAEELPIENPQKQVLLDKADELIKKAEELKYEASKL